MEIQFTKIDNLWVAEFEVTGNFNIHIERDTDGRLDIYQKTAGSKFELVYDTGYLNRRTVYDEDFPVIVAPKMIRVVCSENPSVAIVTQA